MQFENQVVLITGGGGGIGRAAATLPRGGRARGAQRHRQASSRPPATPSTRPASASTSRRPDHHPRAGAGARRLRDRPLRPRRRARQFDRHLPHRPVPRADRGALRGGARLDPPPDLLGLPGRSCSDEGAGRRRDRQRRLDVGGRRDRHHPDQRLLRRAGRPPCADQEPRSSSRPRTSASTRSRSRSSRRPPTSASSPTRRPRTCSTPSLFHPLNRRGQPSDVTEAILFLAGSGTGWITGTTLPVDGGVLAGRSPAVHAEVEALA